jgi:2-methylaconitate cis-trans-isomerase PrpF
MNGVADMEQTTVPCVIMRGGTSKGLYFHRDDLPPGGDDRDRVLKRLMGSPDLLQIDGLGGSRPVTSKVAVIAASERDDADVDYTFGQVDIERDLIGYIGNCGNISSGVGPFAIDEKLVAVTEPITTVRIYNTNTDKVLSAKVPVRDGKAQVHGDCVIAGVPGSGAPIVMDYSGTVGAVSGRLLPTGRVVDTIVLEDGRNLAATLCDVANPCVFVAAADVGLTGNELPEEISANSALMTTIGEIQSKTGQMFGLWPNWQDVSMPGFPLVVLVAPPADYTDTAGTEHGESSMDLRARLLFVNRCHDSMAGTGATCLAAASRIPGSVARRVLTSDGVSSTLRIGHPLGVMDVVVTVDADSQGNDIRFTTLGFARTARRLMAGHAYLPMQAS